MSIDNEDLPTEELAKRAIHAIFGDYLLWESPNTKETVGPYVSDAFDNYTTKITKAISETVVTLKKMNKQELINLIEEIRLENADPMRLIENSTFVTIHNMKRDKPSWFAGGLGHPDYKADFLYWGQMPEYGLDEALLLSVGVEPKHFTKERLNKLQKEKERETMYPALQYLLQRRELMQRTFPTGWEGWLPINKKQLKYWIDKINLDVHADFYTELDKYYPSNKPMKIAKSALDPREKTSLLQIIYVMAMDCYKFDPDSKRIDFVKEIEKRAADNGIQLTSETIRKHLNASKEFYNGSWNSD